MDKLIQKKEYSKAENCFRNYMKEKHSNLKITKKGLPDFMILNFKEEVIGFVEVKRTNLDDNLRKEQAIFRDFCKKYEIPYQIWSPCMGLERWKKANKGFKEAMMKKTTKWKI